jgi:hypothetical protein
LAFLVFVCLIADPGRDVDGQSKLDSILFKDSETLIGVETNVAIDRAGTMELVLRNETSSPITLQFAVEDEFQGVRYVVRAEIRRPSGEIAFIDEKPTDREGGIMLFNIPGKLRFKVIDRRPSI